MKKLYKRFTASFKRSDDKAKADEAVPTTKSEDVASSGHETSDTPSSTQPALVIQRPKKPPVVETTQPGRRDVPIDSRPQQLTSQPSLSKYICNQILGEISPHIGGYADALSRSYEQSQTSPAASHTSLPRLPEPSFVTVNSATCPQFAAKAVSGLRSTMEDCFAIVPDIAAIPRHWLNNDLKPPQASAQTELRAGSAGSTFSMTSSHISKVSEAESASSSNTTTRIPSPAFPPQAASSGAATSAPVGDTSFHRSSQLETPSTSQSIRPHQKVISAELPVSLRSSDTSTTHASSHLSQISQQSTDLYPLIESMATLEPPNPPPLAPEASPPPFSPEASSKKNSGCLSEGARSLAEKLAPLHMFAVYDGHGGAAVAQHISRRMHEHFRVALSPHLSAHQVEGSERLTVASEDPSPSMPSPSVPAASSALQSEIEVLVSGGKEKARSAMLAKVTPPISAPLPTYGSKSGSLDKVKAVLTDSFLSVDTELAEEVNENGVKIAGNTGSTAVVAIVCDSYIWVANCGDSRAIMALKGGASLALSSDHKASRKDEVARVQAAGGMVWWDRVMGELAISRAIGDHRLRPYVIPNPEVSVHTFLPF